MSNRLTRRMLLRAAALTGFAGTAWLGYLRQLPGAVAGKIVGANSRQGHRLRDGELPAGAERGLSAGAVIIGGGVAGLSAAWWLKRNGFHDFMLLELDQAVGGNSAMGKNAVSAYPWGAHYVPLPGPDARYVRELFEEFGVITGYDDQGLPVYDEYFLCAEPEERLFLNGRWQEGLIPSQGLPEADRKVVEEFLAFTGELKSARGRDGKPAFTIPLALSSQDPKYLALDQITMEDFLRDKGWNSRYLNWYVDYCCRDDFGRGSKFVSAWAGLHYFASRKGHAANAESDNVLTWPEGNAWLVNRLRDKVASHIRTGALVSSVENLGGGVRVHFTDTGSDEKFLVKAGSAIFAGPRFVGRHVVAELKRRPDDFKSLVYAPWMVANVTLDGLPTGGIGVPLSWDNVSFYSRSLGYIVATHQNLDLHPRATVLTYYLPLDDKEPAAARREARDRKFADWAELVLADLEKQHKDIRGYVRNVDVMIWGHGMISPEVGFIWGSERAEMQNSIGRIHFAHSDMSGISIFEEAQYHGVRAAEKILRSSKGWKRS